MLEHVGIVSGPSVGKIATVVPPAIQIASSAMKKCAQFFDRIATWAPSPMPCERRCAAIRRACPTTSAQV